MNRTLYAVVVFLVVTGVFLFLSIEGDQERLHRVVEVVDGDTIRLEIDGTVESIRLIGIDTPENYDPVECFGPEAEEKMEELLTDGFVYFQYDETQDRRDKYDRLLGYLILPNGTNVNKKMLEEGYAREYTHIYPYGLQVEFQEAEKQAQDMNLGLWEEGKCL